MPGRRRGGRTAEDSLFGVLVGDTNWPYIEKGWAGFSLPLSVHHHKWKQLQRFNSTRAAGERKPDLSSVEQIQSADREFKLSLQVRGRCSAWARQGRMMKETACEDARLGDS